MWKHPEDYFLKKKFFFFSAYSLPIPPPWQLLYRYSLHRLNHCVITNVEYPNPLFYLATSNRKMRRNERKLFWEKNIRGFVFNFSTTVLYCSSLSPPSHSSCIVTLSDNWVNGYYRLMIATCLFLIWYPTERNENKKKK